MDPCFSPPPPPPLYVLIHLTDTEPRSRLTPSSPSPAPHPLTSYSPCSLPFPCFSHVPALLRMPFYISSFFSNCKHIVISQWCTRLLWGIPDISLGTPFFYFFFLLILGFWNGCGTIQEKKGNKKNRKMEDMRVESFIGVWSETGGNRRIEREWKLAGKASNFFIIFPIFKNNNRN